MLCYVMLCYVMLCYVMLCYVMAIENQKSLENAYNCKLSPIGDNVIRKLYFYWVFFFDPRSSTYIPVYSTPLDKGLSTRKPIE